MMRIAIIGLQGHHGVVLEGARELGGCEIVAMSDGDEQAARRFAEAEALAAGARVYGDWRHLVEHTMMDVAVVCDENGVRAEQLEALAARGVDVVTEKPLATTLEGLERVRRALLRPKSRLTMLLTMRHEGKYATMRRLVRAGAIGEVALATAQKSYQLGQRPEWQQSREKLGGTIPYIGIHSADLIRWITGLDFTHVAALHGNIGRPEMRETENQASLLLRLSNGASATIRLDYLRPMTAATHGDDGLRVAGSKGVIECRGSEADVWLATGTQGPVRVAADPVDNLFVAFVRAVRRGEAAPIPAEDCMYITEVVLRARKAADERAWVEVS